MSIHRQLLLHGTFWDVSEERVHIGLNRIGEGQFSLTSYPSFSAGDQASFYAGVTGQDKHQVLHGRLRKTPDTPQTRSGTLTVRQPAAALLKTVNIFLHHCTIREVIAAIERRIQLKFIVPSTSANYLDRPLEQFKFTGKAIEALQHIIVCWQEKKIVWQQLDDGSLYLGRWNQGPFSAKPLPLLDDWIQGWDKQRKLMVLPYQPALKPGMLMAYQNTTLRINELIFASSHTIVGWTQV